MNDTGLFDLVKATTDATQSAFKAGHDAGYKLGYHEGYMAAMAKAKEMIGTTFPVKAAQS